MIKPGMIVLYTMSSDDADLVRRTRAGCGCSNDARGGDVYPMIVVRVWPCEFGDKPGVNGQVMLDGPDTLWVTSVGEGVGPRTWQPMEADGLVF